jgi:LysR substrate binding domain
MAPDIGHLHLLPLSCEFLKVYPDIALRLLLSDRVLNPVEDKIDVAIRIGPLPDSSMIATRIGSIRVVACASSEYLAARGRPESPDDLSSRDCITLNETGVPRSWKFVSGGNEIAAPIRTRLTVNTSEAAVGSHCRRRYRPGGSVATILTKDARRWWAGSDRSCGAVEQVGDKGGLAADIMTVNLSNLSLPHHRHGLETANVCRAVRKLPKPSPGRTRRLIRRWSCSTMLFRYLHCRRRVRRHS